MTRLTLNPDRLFPAERRTRDIARALYAGVRDLPIISPHGHTDPALVRRERAVRRSGAAADRRPTIMSSACSTARACRSRTLGVPPRDGGAGRDRPRTIWRRFAEHYHLFRGTPSRLWLDHVFAEVFGLDERARRPAPPTSTYDTIDAALRRRDFRPRALFERFNIEVDRHHRKPARSTLDHHRAIRASGWKGRVVTAYRPDPVVDPELEGFAANVARLRRDRPARTSRSWAGYLRRAPRTGARSSARPARPRPTTATRRAVTADLPRAEAEALFDDGRWRARPRAAEAELFRAQMLTEMARDERRGRPGDADPSRRRAATTTPSLFARFGRDKGADIPIADRLRARAEAAARPRSATSRDLTLILFTLDETRYARELAPLAGHYPALRLGPPWWFHDSPEGMRRFRELATETAGFYNTVGFNDDTRAFLSIPARHDVARRVDCAFLARLVAEHRLDEDEAHEVARGLAYDLAKAAYKL